ncbi:MAG: M48 family metallopeptidase [Novosphingobium sp.]
MIDWLRREQADPSVEIAGQAIPLAIRRHARATRMTMRLAPDGNEVRITMPRWGRTAEAIAFAHGKRDWLESQLRAMPARTPPVPAGAIAYRGERLTIDWASHHPRHPIITGGQLQIGGPVQSLESRLRRWLCQEALTLMQADLAHYCDLAGKPCPDLRLSRAQRRWGSCGQDGTIRMNWRLVQAPDHVRRSVVAHEVAHLVHFDHSPAFHALLGQLFEGDIAAANGWLKAHGRTLYATFS